MYNPDADVSPFNSVPPAALLIALVIALVELALQFGANGLAGAQGIGWRVAAIERFGFNGLYWDRMLALGQFPPEHMLRVLSYPFVHGGFLHATFACVIVLAIGKAVGEVFAPAAFLAVFFGASIGGAAVFALLTETRLALIGAYPGGYGLIGAFTFLLWVRLSARGDNEMRAFTLIGFLMGIQLVLGILFGTGPQWIADLAGFILGFVLSFVVSPGGWSKILARLRDR